jgi:hypothetical protein
MTLAELTLPIPYAEARQFGLLFSAAMATRLREVQSQQGNRMHMVDPQQTTDGRYFLNGDVLSECDPSGIFFAGFSHLDPSRFSEIDVVPLADAVALLPPDLVIG